MFKVAFERTVLTERHTKLKIMYSDIKNYFEMKDSVILIVLDKLVNKAYL